MFNRRRFLAASWGTAASVAALSFPVPALLRAQNVNDTIRLGIIGLGSKVKIGGMGRNDMKHCRKVPGVQIAALCDVDSVNLGYALDDCAKNNETPDTFSDLRELLDRPDIDAVWVTTPNHWHALACIWAAQAGKDAFVQKPAFHTLFEGQKMKEAAKKYNRVICSTSLTRSMLGFAQTMDYVKQGNLGKPRYAHCVRFGVRLSIGKVTALTPIPASLNYDIWCGPAAKKPVQRENIHYDWHWDWDYGNGELGNWGIHVLDGTAQAMGAGSVPKRVLSIGGRFGYNDDGQTPNTQIIYWDYDPIPVIYEMRALPREKSLQKSGGKWSDADMDKLHGLPFGVSVVCEGGYTLNNKAFDKDGKQIQQFSSSLPSYHKNFFDAVRRRDMGTEYSIDRVYPGTVPIHLGNISHRVGQEASPTDIRDRIQENSSFSPFWDRMSEHLAANQIDLTRERAIIGPPLTFDQKSETFTGEFADEANRLLRRKDRPEFAVPEAV